MLKLETLLLAAALVAIVASAPHAKNHHDKNVTRFPAKLSSHSSDSSSDAVRVEHAIEAAKAFEGENLWRDQEEEAEDISCPEFFGRALNGFVDYQDTRGPAPAGEVLNPVETVSRTTPTRTHNVPVLKFIAQSFLETKMANIVPGRTYSCEIYPNLVTDPNFDGSLVNSMERLREELATWKAREAQKVRSRQDELDHLGCVSAVREAVIQRSAPRPVAPAPVKPRIPKVHRSYNKVAFTAVSTADAFPIVEACAAAEHCTPIIKGLRDLLTARRGAPETLNDVWDYHGSPLVEAAAQTFVLDYFKSLPAIARAEAAQKTAENKVKYEQKVREWEDSIEAALKEAVVTDEDCKREVAEIFANYRFTNLKGFEDPLMFWMDEYRDRKFIVPRGFERCTVDATDLDDCFAKCCALGVF